MCQELVGDWHINLDVHNRPFNLVQVVLRLSQELVGDWHVNVDVRDRPFILVQVVLKCEPGISR